MPVSQPSRARGQWRTGTCCAYQSKIAHKVGDVLVFALIDPGFDDTEGHGLLDDIVIIRNNALVYTAVKESGRVMSTRVCAVSRSILSITRPIRLTWVLSHLLGLAKLINGHEHVPHSLPLIFRDRSILLN